ncbi:MAG TPA: hypothetical protein VH413_09385 [Verrucomicrobiae bacterium]|jgi:PBP1b-binding outer membrane lipoprotein LpoB|nr:hypothetical protein [Verrucomicrobiae bacterium]
MKKITILLSLMVTGIVLAGCDQNAPSNSTVPPVNTNSAPPAATNTMPPSTNQ